jgi:hypothetical protein
MMNVVKEGGGPDGFLMSGGGFDWRPPTFVKSGPQFNHGLQLLILTDFR